MTSLQALVCTRTQKLSQLSTPLCFINFDEFVLLYTVLMPILIWKLELVRFAHLIRREVVAVYPRSLGCFRFVFIRYSFAPALGAAERRAVNSALGTYMKWRPGPRVRGPASAPGRTPRWSHGSIEYRDYPLDVWQLRPIVSCPALSP